MLPTGRELRQLRESLNVTQKDLAKRIGVTQSFIAKIESGRIDPRVSIVNRILEELFALYNNNDTVDKVMKSPVISVSKETPLIETFKLMDERGISQLPVVNKQGSIIGMIYDFVLLRRVMEKEPSLMKAGDVMDKIPPLLKVESRVDEAVKLLLRSQAVVIIDQKMRPIGIITRSDIIRYKLTVGKVMPWAPVVAYGVYPEETPASSTMVVRKGQGENPSMRHSNETREGGDEYDDISVGSDPEGVGDRPHGMKRAHTQEQAGRA